MSAHIFWPPLAILSMGVMVIIFIILKYGEKLLHARTRPRPQSFETEYQSGQSSENTAFDVDDRTLEEFDDSYEPIETEVYGRPMEIIPLGEKYEYAV